MDTDIKTTGDISTLTGALSSVFASPITDDLPTYNFEVVHGSLFANKKEGSISFDFGAPTTTEYFVRLKLQLIADRKSGGTPAAIARTASSTDTLKIEVQG